MGEPLVFLLVVVVAWCGGGGSGRAAAAAAVFPASLGSQQKPCRMFFNPGRN